MSLSSQIGRDPRLRSADVGLDKVIVRSQVGDGWLILPVSPQEVTR